LDTSHSENVRAIYLDGDDTKCIVKHKRDLAEILISMPYLRIKSHPVVVGSWDWTTTVGMEGTFSKPILSGDRRTIPPNGRKVKLQMANIALRKGGRIV
jgi:hypothetical protein